MADQRKRLSELPSSSELDGLYTLGVDDENEGVKIPIGGIMKNATDKAAAAVTTANEAKTTASSAKTTATNADTNASQAKTKAEAASTLAITANDTANAAKTMATNAQGNANAAVTTANEALDKAEEALNLATSSNDTAEAVSKYIKPRMFINAQHLLNISGQTTLETVIGKLSTHEDRNMFSSPGAVITFLGESGWESWQYTFYLRKEMALPQFDPFERASYWRKFGGSAAVGNTYNVTVDEPKTGFYDLASAVAVAFDKGFNNIGLQITFAIADKSWKTYQFVGADNGETTFKNENNWIDLAGMSAGAETLINIEALCGSCTVAEFYTLEYALAALNKLETESGISYRKVGLIITYRTGQDSFETMQFKEDLGNFGEAGCWKPFGGGGSVETTDSPSNTDTDGKKAFSAKGAFERIPTDFVFDTETEGIVKARLINEAGDTIGNEHQFAVGTGSGGQAGAILEITPKVSPLNGQAGGTIILEAAITLKLGTEFESGIVEKVELYDRDTKQLLETFNKNQATSADKDSFDFTFDLSSYFTSASQRKFQLIAYDDSDRTGSRNVNVNAVDVTIEATQTLNYTSSTVLNVGGSQKSLPMYRFANNASEKGIKVVTEILINGQWKELGTATVNDSYSKSISINPNNCAGVALQHGGYLLRIHGEDIASGIVGNYLFTTVMVVDPSNTRPILASRWYAQTLESPVKKYETISMEFAAYALNANSLTVQVVETIGSERTIKQTTTATRSLTYRYIQRVQNVDENATIALTIEAASNKTEAATFKVVGTLLNIEAVSSQMMFDINLESRSNSNADKTISENGYTLAISGSNYSTNGFVKDSFGTQEYTPNDPDNAPGIMALRIAENVNGSLDYPMFNTASIETNGAAIQFRIRTKNIADDNARLISCIQNGIGFYVTGRKVVFTTDNEATVSKTITSALFNDTITDVAIVIKPTSQSPYGGIGVVEMYFDGELIGTCYYDAGTLSRHNAPISFDGTHGDLYLYNIRAWETFYTFKESFDNYLLKLNDTDAMITEFNFNEVMASQTAEGNPARNIPQMSLLLERGIPCLVMCKSKNTEDVADNYPDYLEGLDGDKKTSRILDWYYYFPGSEWRNIIIEDMPTTNQGTTSSMRPIKNKKGKTKNAGRVRMMYDRDYILANYPEHIAEYDELAALAEKKKIQIVPGTFPTNVFCVKVDYSESGGANNGASTNMYNDLTRALGANYMTPAQVYYTGNYELNPCISSIPCALFRTDTHSPDATLPTHAYFHAKGNYNHDKGDATVFGFENIPGYNDGCLNYGDFYELIAAKGQTLDQFIAAADKSTWEYDIDPETPSKGKWNVIVISEYCGENRRVFRRADNNSQWQETTGSMTYSGGRWRITGDVVNPVENYEIRTYDAMAWFQGVSTPEDMVTPGADGKPKWLTYFESRYPDDDNLNAAYEDGRKVPYNLFKWLQWCNECDQNKTTADGSITLDGVSVAGTPANRLAKFTHELHKIANPYSAICYHGFTDYLACVDQRSKNMMVGFYIEPDGTIRMYLNHLYDGDTILGSDNDCGLTIPAELDPNNDPDGYYQGHDSVLFTQLAKADKIWLSDYNASDSEEVTKSKTTTVAAIIKEMREVEIKESRLRPFSPNGIEKYWITDRLEKWPKLVSSYDGIRKYIEASKPTANYFFALHGLSIQRLRDYVKTRFRYRDDFYECGDTFQSAAQMRCTGRNMSITITAAKDGYFGLGVDRANEARDSVYLKAGETATLYSENTNTGSGIMLYLFGADRIGKLDLTNATPKQQGWDISPMTLLTELKLGGASY
ncbi:MAG: hypothetical protein NC548_44940, partial [Lachnospiraceae bacterium]|nr:hypothetical protein [Lachnospiraceae bacterium]